MQGQETKSWNIILTYFLSLLEVEANDLSCHYLIPTVTEHTHENVRYDKAEVFAAEARRRGVTFISVDVINICFAFLRGGNVKILHHPNTHTHAQARTAARFAANESYLHPLHFRAASSVSAVHLVAS